MSASSSTSIDAGRARHVGDPKYALRARWPDPTTPARAKCGGGYAAFRKATLMFCGVLNQKGFVKAGLKAPLGRDDWSELRPRALQPSYRHDAHGMGASPSTGVVDRDCRVFGVANLYVAGSSIFPASDCSNPTLNLVAMAGRLADHLSGTPQ